MDIRLNCEYCGNTSGKTNTWGGCISCGAPLSEAKITSTHVLTPYTGQSGSYSANNLGYLSVNEIRDMVRRSVGLQ